MLSAKVSEQHRVGRNGVSSLNTGIIYYFTAYNCSEWKVLSANEGKSTHSELHETRNRADQAGVFLTQFDVFWYFVSQSES